MLPNVIMKYKWLVLNYIKLAKYAIKLHDMLKGVSEAEGLEGWVQSKITKSADMIGSVYHHMDYENSPMGEVTEARDADSCSTLWL